LTALRASHLGSYVPGLEARYQKVLPVGAQCIRALGVQERDQSKTFDFVGLSWRQVNAVAVGNCRSDEIGGQIRRRGTYEERRQVTGKPRASLMETRNEMALGSLNEPNGQAAMRRLALTKREAAAALGVSVDSFERHVQPELRVVRRGRLRLFALVEIERWLHENGAKTIEPS
jgi:hypothetical protein